MMKSVFSVIIDESFEQGQCDKCPVAQLPGDGYGDYYYDRGYLCPFGWKSDECHVCIGEIKEGDE